MGSIDDKIPKDCHRIVHLRSRYCSTYCNKPVTEENKCPYLGSPAPFFQKGAYYCKNETENLVLKQQKPRYKNR